MPTTLTIERFEAHPIWGDCVFFTARSGDAEAVRHAYGRLLTAFALAQAAELGLPRLVRRVGAP